MRRVDYIAVAKGIRDSKISRNARATVANSIIKYISQLHPTMDKDSFRAMADAEQNHRDRFAGHHLEKALDEQSPESD